ncbi:G2/mitotic-specific cyclin-B [Capsaspora owczarzaki ATCC 30864]|uniref:G2/mitotic-specific cyclin-B n=2 Tax=Capsaspora owczarzaki (strain ATCC 30864) TaxID=595528 RepID=A0A0D2VZD9_CAPO3|nr:G2/mitotic-specific cyclin-B [Capsaspora owczarzaki ATCC 30864]
MDTDSTHVEAPAHAAAAVATSAALPALDRCVSIAPAPEQTAEQTVPPHLHHHQQVGKSSAMAPLARHATFASWPAANAAAAAVNARASQSTLISAAQARLSNAVKPTRPIPAGVPNLDEEDYDLSLMYVPEYAAEIYEYLNNLQHVYAINPTYLSRQPEITARMRSILVGWLFQVHQTWPFKQETLYLAVHVLDRFLQRRQVPRTRLQLIGLTSFIIAAKYEEIYIPEITEFVALTHNLFSSQDVLVAESEILVALGFNLGTPSPLHFLRRGYRASPCRPKTYTFAKYMCELSLYSAEMLEFPQSTIAGAALFVSRRITSPTEVAWDDSMQFYLFTPYEAMLRCARTLLELLRVAHTDNVYEAVYNRFRDEANQRVSRIPLNAEKLELVFKDI